MSISNNRGGSLGPPTKSNEECGIREVWRHNLEEEFRALRKVVAKYPYVAMDTEFPGVVARPIGEFKSTADYQYQLLRCNVGLLKLIQVGLSFMDEKGVVPPDYSTWQFNFKFSLGEDMYAQDSIELLTSSGIQFQKHEEDGIDVNDFAELLTTSGLVLTDDVKWLSFHSGYDFGYLLKLLTNQPLPNEESEFFELLQIFFPCIYDVKYLMKSCKNLKGGLQEVADMLEVDRIGPQHQAGSDSLLTGHTFFKMKEMFFEDRMDDGKYCGHLYGLGTGYGQNGVVAHEELGVIANGNAVNASSQSAVGESVGTDKAGSGNVGAKTDRSAAVTAAPRAGSPRQPVDNSTAGLGEESADDASGSSSSSQSSSLSQESNGGQSGENGS